MDADERWRREIFAEYSEHRRGERIPGFDIEVLPDITRYPPTASMGDEALLAYARFTHGDAGGADGARSLGRASEGSIAR